MSDATPIPTAHVPLGPDAIVEYELPRAKRGYDRKEVDDLLDRLAAQTGELVREVAALRDERRTLLARLEESSEAESTLKRTLVTAQRAAELSVQEAESQAEEIRARAVERAEELIARAADEAHELRDAAQRRARADETEARRRRRSLEEHVEELRVFADDHRERVAHHLRQQLARLDAMEAPAPPSAPTAADDPVIEEPTLDQDVDDLVAELALEVAGTPADDPPDAATPASADATPPGTPPSDPDGPAVGADLDDLLARIDEAAAEVADTHEHVTPEDTDGTDHDTDHGREDEPPGPWLSDDPATMGDEDRFLDR